ncbi:MAG: Gfo/Idh/MocA family oxidoreductase, partial [Pseudomonadota bacterium]
CGPITHVQAFEANTQRQAAAEEVVAATLRFASGALGTLNLSDTALAPWSWELTAGENPAYPKTDQSSYMIGGTHGALSLPNLALWSQENGPDWWAPMSATRYPVDSIDTLVAQLAHFGDVVQRKAAPRVSATDGLRAVAVVEAIKRAAQNGGTITLE